MLVMGHVLSQFDTGFSDCEAWLWATHDGNVAKSTMGPHWHIATEYHMQFAWMDGGCFTTTGMMLKRSTLFHLVENELDLNVLLAFNILGSSTGTNHKPWKTIQFTGEI